MLLVAVFVFRKHDPVPPQEVDGWCSGHDVAADSILAPVADSPQQPVALGTYSVRSAISGLTRVARYAGTAVATSATAARIAETATNVIGSAGWTS